MAAISKSDGLIHDSISKKLKHFHEIEVKPQTKQGKYTHIPRRYHGVGEWSSCTEKGATLELLF